VASDLTDLGYWLVHVALVDDLAFASKRIGKAMADEHWKAQLDSPTSSTTLIPRVFLQCLQEESETRLELLQQLWEHKSEDGISTAATNAFNTRLTDLQNESQDQFVSLWRSRVVLKLSLYSQGLISLQPSPLKDQLSDLLSTYLIQDLIPNAIKRAKTKGLIRTPHLIKQVTKLEAIISPEKKEKEKDKSPHDALAKFSKKIGLEQPTSTEISAAKKEHLKDMLAAMQKDTDAPRLFLSLVIILVVSRRDGVVYATGKFAPRLLKVVRGEFGEGEEVLERVEEIKDVVKKGEVDGEVRKEMRAIAGKVLEAWLEKGDGPAEAEGDEKVNATKDD
jgi:hypothetical protein